MNVEDLKQFSLLAEFGDDDRDALFELLEERRLPAGRRIFAEGSEAEGLILLASGCARIESRRGVAPQVAEAGASFGGLSLVSVGPRQATVIAETPCEFLSLPRDRWHRLVEDNPRTACRLTQAIAAQLAGLVREELDQLCG